MTVVVLAPWIPGYVNLLHGATDAIRLAASISINDSARRALKNGAEEISKQIGFPPGYLNEQRLFIKKFAANGDLEAVVAGRGRATSLLRFAAGNYTPESTRPGGADVGRVAIRVKPGGGLRSVQRGFVLRLKSGRGITEENFNLGLAIRLKPGQAVDRKYKQSKPIFKNVYLLYGPSVAQALQSEWPKLAPKISQFLDTEFARQLGVQLGK